MTVALADNTPLGDAADSGTSEVREELQFKIVEVFDRVVRLRATLERYEAELTEISARVEDGEPAISSVAHAIGPLERRRVSEAIEEFEAARRRLRVAFLALRHEEGATIGDVAEALGISPQLASRLVTEERNR